MLEARSPGSLESVRSLRLDGMGFGPIFRWLGVAAPATLAGPAMRGHVLALQCVGQRKRPPPPEAGWLAVAGDLIRWAGRRWRQRFFGRGG